MDKLDLIIKFDEEEPEAAEVYVDGSIDGKPYRFLLDTGAAKSRVIFDEYTSTLNSTEKNSSSGVFAPIVEELVTVSTLEVGPISRQNFTLTRGSPADVRPISLIGMDVLKDFTCHFLFDEAQLFISPKPTPEDNTYPFQPLLLDRVYHPYVEVHRMGGKANAVWDTGASLTIVDLNFVNRHPDWFTHIGQSTGMDAGGAQMETPMFMMSEVAIGSHTFLAHKVAGVDLSPVNATLEVPMDFILGYTTLIQAHWIFDFPGKRWAISKRLNQRG